MTEAGGPELGVAEAAATYGTSVSTIRRLLAAGKLPGARRVPGPKGPEYRIPAAALEALGYEPPPGGPATVRTAQAEADRERLSQELEEANDELERLRLNAELAAERARLLEASVSDLRTGAPVRSTAFSPASSTAVGWREVVALGVLAALMAIVVLALTRAGGHDVSVDVAPVAAAGPVAPSEAPVGPGVVPSVAPTSAVPTTTVAPPTTSVEPSTVPTGPPAPDLEAARRRYVEITDAVNPVLAELHEAWGYRNERTARDVCALLANVYRDLYVALDRTPWPAAVRPAVERLVRSSAEIEADLRECARARSGWAALEHAGSDVMDRLESAVGTAATDVRLALGLPATPGLVLPQRQL